MTTAAVQNWMGRSDEIAVPLLGAEFWSDGKVISGTFDGAREQKIGGFAYKLILDEAVSVDGSDEELVELPSLTGVKYALQSLRQKGYQFRKGDMWKVTCTGVKHAKKEGFSDSPEFQIEVIRK